MTIGKTLNGVFRNCVKASVKVHVLLSDSAMALWGLLQPTLVKAENA